MIKLIATMQGLKQKRDCYLSSTAVLPFLACIVKKNKVE